MSPQFFAVILCYVPILPFIAIAIPHFYHVPWDLTVSQMMTSPTIHRKKITKFSGENFICSLGTQWILKPHLLIFSFSLFRKCCVCALTQKQSFHLCSGSSWPPYLASSFIPFLLCNFYIFISTDTFLFLILYSNFSCLKKK